MSSAAGLRVAGRRLILARHGQTDWNAQGRFQGQADPPLNATGVSQAQRLAGEMIGLVPDILVCSDRVRAWQTARAVAVACSLEVQTDDALREVDLGGWEGLRPQQVADRFPDEYRCWREGGDPRRGGGETEAEAGRRAVGAVRRTLEGSPPQATILVVAHGRVLRSAMARLGEEGLISFAGPPVHLANGGWLLFDVGDRRVTNP